MLPAKDEEMLVKFLEEHHEDSLREQQFPSLLIQSDRAGSFVALGLNLRVLFVVKGGLVHFQTCQECRQLVDTIYLRVISSIAQRFRMK